MISYRSFRSPKIAILLLACAGIITGASATTFVVLSTNKQIVLGIDTKQGHQRNGRIVDDVPVCKVVTRKSTAYALSGFTGMTRKADLYPVLNGVATDDVDATMLAIAGPAKKFLEQHVPTIGAKDLEMLAPPGKPITVIIGIGFNRNGILRDLSFFVNNDRSIKSVPETLHNPMALYPERGTEISIVLPVIWYNEADLTRLVRKMMDAGIKTNQYDSGYPISVVSISQFGLNQPDRPDICKQMDVRPKVRSGESKTK